MSNQETNIVDIRQKASEALRKAALNEEAKGYILSNPVLFNMLLKAAQRYIGGENLAQALATRKKLKAHGFATSLEFMGESVTTFTEAKEATQEFLQIINTLKAENQPDRVSLDLSHLGLFLDYELGLENFRLLAKATENSLVDLFISAEGLDRTDAILDTYLMFSKEFPNINITLQAYLHRTEHDLSRVLQNSPGKIRIVKGAYDGPKEQFLPRSVELNNRYLEMVETIFNAGRFCSIATHDTQILNQILTILDQRRMNQIGYEFEMLYGIGTDQLNDLKKQGHPCRQYIVYGKEWYLYLCNRIAENPENVFRALVDIMT
jgi:proline dehydrogenase